MMIDTPSRRLRAVPLRLVRLSIYDAAAFAVFIAILLAAIVPRFDTDFWWHLFVGRYIAAHGSVPTRDFLSGTFTGHAWIDHEWLGELGMYGLYRLGGFVLIDVAFGLVVAAAFALSYATMRVRGANCGWALAATLLAAAISLGSWGPRIQMLSLMFAAAAVLCIERYRRSRNARWLAPLPVMGVLWSNIHGGFVLGLLLISLYITGGYLDRRREGATARSALASGRPLWIALALTGVASLLTPNTYRQLEYPLKFVTPNAFTNAIQESASPNFHLPQLMLFEGAVLALIVACALKQSRTSWVDILIMLVMTHLALQQTRNVAVWAIVVVPLLAVYVQDAVRPVFTRLQRYDRALPSSRLTLINWALVGLVAVAFIVQAGKLLNRSTVYAAETSGFPHGAVTYLRTHHVSGQMFNSYSYGGYVIWKLYPQYRVFIDSRADTLYDRSMLADYLTVYDAAPRWSNVLSKYHVAWVFIERQAPLAQVLRASSQWRTVYLDDSSIIVVRDTAPMRGRSGATALAAKLKPASTAGAKVGTTMGLHGRVPRPATHHSSMSDRG